MLLLNCLNLLILYESDMELNDILCPECRSVVKRYIEQNGSASRSQLQFKLAAQLTKKASELMRASERDLILIP